MAPAREVAFELECFEWADERLEVAGRWKGLGSHSLNRPVLTIDTENGRRKRIVALPGGQLGAAWRASFSWPGDPAEIAGAELEVGGNLVVDLPLPDRKRRRRRRPASEQPTDDALRAETVALHGQVERLRAELAGREREIIALRAQLDEVDEEESRPPDADERTVEIQRLADELERLRGEKLAGAEAMTVEVQRIVAERDAAIGETEVAVAAERARWQADIDELHQAFSDAAAEAEESRDKHQAELAAVHEQLHAERAEVTRLTAELAQREEAAARERAAAPPTEPMPPPGDSSAGPATQAMPPPAGGDATVETAVLSEPGKDVQHTSPVVAAGSSAFQALKARFEGLFATNGDGHDEEPAMPRPLRTASAARARAGATVAARRSPGEVWATRVLAAVVVAVLLTAFVLILIYIA